MTEEKIRITRSQSRSSLRKENNLGNVKVESLREPVAGARESIRDTR